MALAYASSRALDPVCEDVLAKWQTSWRLSARDPMELDTTQIDWIIKKRLIESFMDRKKLGWGDSQVDARSAVPRFTRPDKGLYYICSSARGRSSVS